MGRKRSNDDVQANSRKKARTNGGSLPRISNHFTISSQLAAHQASDEANLVSVGVPFDPVPDLDKSFYNTIKSPRYLSLRIMGITGGSNHCYRNAVLTAFLSLPYVMNYLIAWHAVRANGERRSAKTSVMSKLVQILAGLFLTNTPQTDMNRFVAEFWEQFCYQKTSEKTNVKSPSHTSWRMMGKRDTAGRQEFEQQDAHEFLSWMLGKISDQFQARVLGQGSNAALGRFHWFLQSRIARHIICKKCRYPVRRRMLVEQQWCLLLHIPSNSSNCQEEALPLQQLVDSAMRDETDGHCARCKRRSWCVQERRFQHAPPILILVLNRAKTDETGRGWKDSARVLVHELLDISTHLNVHEFGAGSKVTYSLMSVVSHSGAYVDGGHYVSCVRGGQQRNESWFEINDDQVNASSLNQLNDGLTGDLSPGSFTRRLTPYVLFFQRDFLKNPLPVPGRGAHNQNEGDDEDEQPSHWLGGERAVTPQKNVE